MMSRLVSILVLLCQLLSWSAGSSVLVLHPFYGGSHILTLRRLSDALTARGHKVTVLRWLDVQSYPPQTNPNLSEIVLSVNNSDGIIPFVTQDSTGKFFVPGKIMWESGLTLKVFPLEGITTMKAYCQELLGNERLYEHLRKQQFKVAIVDMMFNDCGFALAHKLGVPAVGFWGFNFGSGPSHYTSLFNPPSTSPQIFSTLRDHMTFMERVRNVLYFFGIQALMELEFFVMHSVILNYVDNCPHPSKLLANMSGMLINSHPLIDYPRLLPASFQEVGGLHLRKNRPLPKDILDFMESTDEGVILFSLGFNFDPEYVPVNIYEKYFRAFGRLKQKVIVRTKGVPSFLPSNVKIFPFFPQADILAHNKTVLFISHCGFHGVMEAIYNAVPILGIPVYLDQMDNLVRLMDLGLGRGIDKDSSVDEIYGAIMTMLKDLSYKENMKIISGRVKAYGNPMERAVWLLEHTMETNGGHHLKLSSRHLGLISYLCLDVLFFLLFVFCSCIFIVFGIITKLTKMLTLYKSSYKLKDC